MAEHQSRHEDEWELRKAEATIQREARKARYAGQPQRWQGSREDEERRTRREAAKQKAEANRSAKEQKRRQKGQRQKEVWGNTTEEQQRQKQLDKASVTIQRTWRAWRKYCQDQSDWMATEQTAAGAIQVRWRLYQVRRKKLDQVRRDAPEPEEDIWQWLRALLRNTCGCCR
ncbi:unnamed protein product [Symbiodinium pilosum]|uniref:Uncharacterized protein n=1 Tax=Symbiodinium pilosum TaxID=2952 RepID=A0A812W4G3_SYMPI|nr:unnamed protein product [Symbiodinium pilosum]